MPPAGTKSAPPADEATSDACDCTLTIVAAVLAAAYLLKDKLFSTPTDGSSASTTDAATEKTAVEEEKEGTPAPAPAPKAKAKSPSPAKRARSRSPMRT